MPMPSGNGTCTTTYSSGEESGYSTKWYVHYNPESEEYHIATWIDMPSGGREIDSFFAKGKKEALAKGDCVVDDFKAKMAHLAEQDEEET